MLKETYRVVLYTVLYRELNVFSSSTGLTFYLKWLLGTTDPISQHAISVPVFRPDLYFRPDIYVKKGLNYVTIA